MGQFLSKYPVCLTPAVFGQTLAIKLIYSIWKLAVVAKVQPISSHKYHSHSEVATGSKLTL